MRNDYARKLNERKRRREVKATREGMQFGLSLCTVALNNKFGFGRKRLLELEQEIDRLMLEFDEPDIGAHLLVERLNQIMGEDA